MSSLDRRTNARVGFKVPAHILLGQGARFHRGYVMNLSDAGAFVIMDDAIDLDAQIVLRFRYQNTECAASGHLAHIVPLGAKQGFGIELTWRNAEFARFVRTLENASQYELMACIRAMKRVDVWVGDATS